MKWPVMLVLVAFVIFVSGCTQQDTTTTTIETTTTVPETTTTTLEGTGQGSGT